MFTSQFFDICPYYGISLSADINKISDSGGAIIVLKKQSSRIRHAQADKNYIEVMGKIFAVLEFMVESGEQKSVAFSELTRALPFARTTVHRILYSLEKLGYLERDEMKSHYHLTAKFFELTGPAVHFRRLRSLARGVMQSLMLHFGETINLGALENGQVVYIEVLQSPSALRIAATPGELNPIHCTALGKAMIAFLPQDEIEELLSGNPLIKRTPRTITQKKHLLEHLASVRERGVALDMEENLTGVVCIAGPVFDQTGRVVAGLSISGPASRMEAKLPQVQQEIRASALALSRMLSPTALPSRLLTDPKRIALLSPRQRMS